MKKELAVAMRQPVLFLDDWPEAETSLVDQEKPGLTDVKKWRLQMLLAVNPWGIPSLGLGEAYKRMYHHELNVQDLGFEHLFDMVSNLRDVFAIQEPDEVTALMFPDYPHDRILHDARFEHYFDNPNLSDQARMPDHSDPELLNTCAWINRDDDFPPDVVLAGEQYTETILPMTQANIPGTRGVHQAVLMGAATPDHFFISIKSELRERAANLSNEVHSYFRECGLPKEMYSVPDEFIYRGFPCLVYVEKDDWWERCEIIGKSPRSQAILIETVDYGGTFGVDKMCLHLMPKKFFDFPKQAILASMIGIKPSNDEKWCSGSGRKLRNFSNQNYYLDCLLLDPPKDSQQNVDKLEETKSVVAVDEVSEIGCANDTQKDEEKKKKKRTRKLKKKTQFEVIVCDRNDDELDMYVDEVLVMETLAQRDTTRTEEVEKMKQKLNDAFSRLPRPENPLQKPCPGLYSDILAKGNETSLPVLGQIDSIDQ